MSKDDFFVPENAKSSEEHLSASGEYKLKVTWFKTKVGSWNYTQGLVYRKGDDAPIAEVRRNYSAFPFRFVEDHPSGHPYLVCGEDYQGQTVIELDTGRRRDHLSEGANKGHGFCWANYEFHPGSQTLIVDGCYWAAPYEFKFYDFSNPMEGWPEIEFVDSYAYADPRKPAVNDNDTITVFQTEAEADDEAIDDNETDEEEAARAAARPIAATRTFRREGLKLVLAEEWISDKEKDRRIRCAEAERKYKEFWANFEATDSLYLVYKELVKDPSLSPDNYFSRGVTYKDWCPGVALDEPRHCHRVVKRDGLTVDFEWAVKTGPVKVDVFRNGGKAETKFFMEHSADSIRAAFTYIRGVLNG